MPDAGGHGRAEARAPQCSKIERNRSGLDDPRQAAGSAGQKIDTPRRVNSRWRDFAEKITAALGRDGFAGDDTHS